MKKTLLTLFVAATAAFTASAQTNLVKNGDFEKWNTDGTPAEWAALSTKDVPTATNITAKQAEGRSGKGVEVPSLEGKNGLQNTRLTQRIALAAGEYNITFWAKGSVEGNIAYAGHVEEVDGKPNSSAYKYQAKPGVALKTTEWTQVTYDFKLENATTIYVIARNDKGVNGSIFVDDFALTSKGATPQPNPTPQPEPQPQPQPQPAEGVVYEIAFDTNAEGWTFDNVTLPQELTYVWSIDDTRKFLKASAFVKPNNFAAEAIAVSPEIHVGADNMLSFEHAANFVKSDDMTQIHQVLVRVGATGAWEVLNVPTRPDGKSWTFVGSGDISLAKYAQKKIQIGFKYTSSTANASTWEIKNLKVTGTKPTSISTTQIAPAVETIYDLSGRRVNSAAKGIFIVNGKKVVR